MAAGAAAALTGPELARCVTRNSRRGDIMSDRDRRFDSTDGKVERAKDAALGKHDSNPSHVDEVAEGVGGVGGVLTGAALGSGAGPIGTIVGGIAGAVGGWWAGRAETEAASTLTREGDGYYRGHDEQ